MHARFASMCSEALSAVEAACVARLDMIYSQMARCFNEKETFTRVIERCCGSCHQRQAQKFQGDPRLLVIS